MDKKIDKTDKIGGKKKSKQTSETDRPPIKVFAPEADEKLDPNNVGYDKATFHESDRVLPAKSVPYTGPSGVTQQEAELDRSLPQVPGEATQDNLNIANIADVHNIRREKQEIEIQLKKLRDTVAEKDRTIQERNDIIADNTEKIRRLEAEKNNAEEKLKEHEVQMLDTLKEFQRKDRMLQVVETQKLELGQKFHRNVIFYVAITIGLLFTIHGFYMQAHTEAMDNVNQQLKHYQSMECFPKTCKDVRPADRNKFSVKLFLPGIGVTDVRCDFEGGEWLVILRRSGRSENFDRNWTEYASGFGNLTTAFWMGLEKQHILTSKRSYELRIDMENSKGEKRFAKYSKFIVGSMTEKYKLTVGGYSGDAGDAFTNKDHPEYIHDQNPFTTKDNKNDDSGDNCAKTYKGGWWFNRCFQCHLTGPYLKTEVVDNETIPAIRWDMFRRSYSEIYSLKFVEMKIRPMR